MLILILNPDWLIKEIIEIITGIVCEERIDWELNGILYEVIKVANWIAKEEQ